MTPLPFSTKQKILDAAEQLFAQVGFSAASLRRVTADAKVNLAAVNYHFGSKDRLIEEVFRRRLDVLNDRRLAALHTLDANATLEDVLGAYIRPALELSMQGHGGQAFVRILARSYADDSSQLRRFLSTHYKRMLQQFVAGIGRCLPELSREELYWRLDIVTGALTYAMSRFGMIQRRPHVSEQQHLEVVAQHLIHFAAAGLRSS